MLLHISTMESQNLDRTKKSIHDKLRLFRELGGKGGLGKGRVWLLLDKSSNKTKKSCQSHMTLPDLLNIKLSNLHLAFGKKWKGSQFTKGELSAGFYTYAWKEDVFVTVSDGAPTGPGNVPKK